jgi:hypothetical protein
MNERYVCWNREEIEIRMDQEIMNDKPAPECISCEEEMEFFGSESRKIPDSPTFGSDENLDNSERN